MLLYFLWRENSGLPPGHSHLIAHCNRNKRWQRKTGPFPHCNSHSERVPYFSQNGWSGKKKCGSVVVSRVSEMFGSMRCLRGSRQKFRPRTGVCLLCLKNGLMVWGYLNNTFTSSKDLEARRVFEEFYS